MTKHSAPHKKVAEPLPPAVQTTDPVRRYLEMQPLTGGLTAPVLQAALPGLNAARANKWVDALNAAFRKYEITGSLRRVAALLGHMAQESGRLDTPVENLNYTAAQLLQYFSAFDDEQAKAYAHKPEAIANRAYANRIGNGDEASGDGWKYRGRGFIQLTGKKNYAVASKEFGVDFVENPDLIATPQYAAISAAFFFKKNGLNELADREQYQALSKRVNKSLKSFPSREKHRKRALDALVRAALTNITVSALNAGMGIL